MSSIFFCLDKSSSRATEDSLEDDSVSRNIKTINQYLLFHSRAGEPQEQLEKNKCN